MSIFVRKKLVFCGFAEVFCPHKSQICKLSHLRKVRKSNKFGPQVCRFAICVTYHVFFGPPTFGWDTSIST